MNSKLLDILDSIVLEKKLEIEQKEYLLFSSLYELNTKLKDVLENPELISEFDLEKLNSIISINNQEFRLLKFLKKCSQSQIEDLKLTESNKILIIDYFKKYQNLIEIKKEEILSGNQEFQKLKEKYEKLLELQDKIINNTNFDKQDFLLLSSYLKENITDVNEYIGLIKELSLFVCGGYEKSLQVEEVSLVRITNLERVDVESLFNEFDLKFGSFRPKEQDKILLYGSLENIRNILTILKENNIYLNINHSYSQKISEVLLLSNQRNVSVIIENIKTDLKNLSNDEYNLNLIFTSYLNSPSLFINGLKKYETKRRKITKKQVDNDDLSNSQNEKDIDKENLKSGSFNNYQINRKYLIDLGADINAIVKKCSTSLTRFPKTLKTNFESLLVYGIDKKVIFDTLSSLEASIPLDIIDQYIEAGFHDYIVNALSRIKGELNPPQLFKMINAKRNGWPYFTDDTSRKNSIFSRNQATKKQICARNKILKQFPGDRLFNEIECCYENEYHDDLEKNYVNIDFTIQEPIGDFILSNSLIKALDNNFKNDDLTYKFNEIIVSRYKVLRYFSILLKNGKNTFEDLKYAIFKNAIITKREYDMVLSCLNQIFKHQINDNQQTSLNDFWENGVPKDILLNNFFVKFLDNNFYKNSIPYYDFNGIQVLRDDVLRNFSILLIKKEVMPDPLEALFASIIKGKNFNTEEYDTIAKCLNEASEGIIDMGRRL